MQDKQLTVAKKGEIIRLTKAGFSPKNTAIRLGISRSTVARWQERFATEENVMRKAGTGWQIKHNCVNQDIPIHRFASANPIITARQIGGKWLEWSYFIAISTFLLQI